jgi:nicotinamidase-related amidase
MNAILPRVRSIRRMRQLVTIVSLAVLLLSASQLSADTLELQIRRQIRDTGGLEGWSTVKAPAKWNAHETAVIVCDMWDAHWCRGATARVAEMAPRMNEVLTILRDKGALVIHCPSNCMQFYEGTQQRKLAQSAPPVAGVRHLKESLPFDPHREAALPIDDYDGGCDCEPQCRQFSPYTRQIAALEIGPDDAVTDSVEAYYLMRARGIKNVIVMGVHANMCILARPFAIRQLVAQDLNVVLMRDLTDTMYNSRRRPNVSHFRGTGLVVSHIERYWCGTVSSNQVTGKEPFQFFVDGSDDDAHTDH